MQALGGAKNHMVVMPDAVIEKTVDGLIGSGFGAAGQRCMAGSVVVTVGDAHDKLLPPLKAATEKLRVGDGLEEGVDVGPVVSEAARERIRAAVGPCIGQASYEVGQEFVDRFTAAEPAFEAFFIPGAAPGKRMFDLPGFVLSRLRAAGVTRCEWIGRDTCAEPDLFFSNRRAFRHGEPDYGRLLSAIMLEP